MFDTWAHLFQAEKTGKEQASGLGASRQGDVMKCAPKIWQTTTVCIVYINNIQYASKHRW